MRWVALAAAVSSLACNTEQPKDCAPEIASALAAERRKDAEREQQAKDDEARGLRAEAEKKQRELEAKLAEIRALEERIAAAAGDPDELERIQKELAEAQKDAKRLGGQAPSRPAAGCAPGDPLCASF